MAWPHFALEWLLHYTTALSNDGREETYFSLLVAILSNVFCAVPGTTALLFISFASFLSINFSITTQPQIWPGHMQRLLCTDPVQDIRFCFAVPQTFLRRPTMPLIDWYCIKSRAMNPLKLRLRRRLVVILKALLRPLSPRSFHNFFVECQARRNNEMSDVV